MLYIVYVEQHKVTTAHVVFNNQNNLPVLRTPDPQIFLPVIQTSDLLLRTSDPVCHTTLPNLLVYLNSSQRSYTAVWVNSASESLGDWEEGDKP